MAAGHSTGVARSAGGVAHLLRYAVDAGLTPRVALAGTGLTPAALDAGAEVTAAQELRVLRTLLRHVGPDGGAALGRSYRLTTYGALGYAVLASATVGEAIALALRYFELSHAFVTPDVRLADGHVVLDLAPPELEEPLRGFVLDRDAEAVRTALGELLPVGSPVVRAGRRITFAAALLDQPVAEAGRADLAATCEELLARRRVRTGVAGDTRVLVVQRLADGAPMPEVAAALGLSERSLRRHLADAGTSYRALVDEVRSSLAEALLAGGVGTAEVAARLGYAEAAAFCHARARWRG